MMFRTATLATLLAFGLSGCSTFGANISGDWTCKAAKSGGCRTTHEIDADVLNDEAPAISLMPLPGGLPAPAPSASDGETPVLGGSDELPPPRSADTVARIVFLPFVDNEGVFHARAVAYAVMTHGVWIAGPKE